MSPAPLFSFLWSEELADVQAGLFPSCGLSLLCSWDYRGMSQHQLYWALRPVTFHCFIPKSINVGFCINTTQRDLFTPLTHAPVPIYHPTTSGKTYLHVLFSICPIPLSLLWQVHVQFLWLSCVCPSLKYFWPIWRFETMYFLRSLLVSAYLLGQPYLLNRSSLFLISEHCSQPPNIFPRLFFFF